MKTFKKILAVCMAAVLLAAPASLAGGFGFAAEIVERGDLSLAISYTLDSDGVLTVTEIPLELVDGFRPRDLEDLRGVRSVVFAEGVLVVPHSFFDYLPALDSVTLADSVSLLAQESFAGCRAKHLTIGRGLSIIDEEALNGIRGLESITVAEGNPFYHSAGNCLIETAAKTLVLGSKNSVIPADGSVVRIADGAFDEIPENLTVPDCVTRIEDSFRYGDWFEAQPDGVVYAGKVAVGYKGDMPENTDLVLQDGCLGIADSAFSGNYHLRSVTIPQGVEYIGNNAFGYCTNLVSVSVPDSVTAIGHNDASGHSDYGTNPFHDTPWYNAQPDGVVYAGKVALCFKGDAPQDTDLTLRADCVGIAANAFYNCGWLTGVAVPDGVVEIGDCAFYWSEGLTSLSLGSGLKRIGAYAFDYCKGLTGRLTVPNGVTEIGNFAFKDCDGLTALTLGSGLKRIGDDAFSGCTGLTALTIPNGVTHIGNWAFGSCKGLSSAVLPNSVKCLGFNAFYECSGLTGVSFGSGLKYIGYHAFYLCKLGSVAIPRSVEYISRGAFSGNATIERITAESGGAYRSAGNCLIETATKTLIAGCKNSAIPNDGSVETVGAEAFINTGLAAVTLPGSLRRIEGTAFAYNPALTGITLPAGLRFIGCEAFMETGLTSVTLPESLEYVGFAAFAACYNLKALAFPRGVAYIGPGVAVLCPALESVTVSAGNPYYYSVNNCLVKTDAQKLVFAGTNAVIPTDGSLKSIGIYALWNNVGSEFTVPDGVESLGFGALLTEEPLTAVRIPTSVTYISPDAFDSGLTDIYYAGTEAQWQQITTDRYSDFYYEYLEHGYNWGTPPQVHYNVHWHTWTQTGETPATCAVPGERTYACACGETKTEAIPATGNHTAGQPTQTVLSSPTCTVAGQKRTVVKCSVCGKTLSDVTEKIPANGHRYTVIVNVKEPTCTGSGYTVYKCENCSETEVRNRTDALGHDFRDGVCTRCGQTQSDSGNSGSPNFFARLRAFFQRIIDFFRNLFKR